jgi:hypothetical protein
MDAAIVVANANLAVATAGSRFTATKLAKNNGKIAVMIVV